MKSEATIDQETIPGLYVAQTHCHLTIIAADNLLAARRLALEEMGTYDFVDVWNATEFDLNWYEAMGGIVPSLRTRQSVIRHW